MSHGRRRLVTVKMDGQSLLGKIDPKCRHSKCCRMVLAACNEAVKKVDDETKQKMGGLLGGMGLPPGLL